MLIKKAGLLLILFTISSCTTKKTVVVIPEHNAVIQDESVLRNDFEKNIGHKVYVAFDSAILSQEAKDRLQKQAEWLIDHSNVIATIEGHCDERGTREYNIALGERRAHAVKGFLAHHGVDSKRIETISYGKERPEVIGDNEAAWSKNRRGVTALR